MARYPGKPEYRHTEAEQEFVDLIEKELAGHHPDYRYVVFWRFRRQYPVAVRYAVKAVRAGYSNPCAAAADRVIPWREPQPGASRCLDP